MITEKKRLWLKAYRQRNKVHIRKTSKARYIKNREHRLKIQKQWAKANPERIREYGLKRWHSHSKLNKIRQLTKYYFNDFKSKSVCKNCNSKERLEFHHLKPIAYDNFVILCFNCHRMLHKQLLPQFANLQKPYSIESRSVKQ